MQLDLDKITKGFLLNEAVEPTLAEYLNVVSEMVSKIKPATTGSKALISVLQENLRRARKQARIMEERLNILEEQVRIIEEVKEDDE